MRSAPSIADSATLLLDTLHPTYQLGEMSESRYIDRAGESQRAFHPNCTHLVASGKRRAASWNVYFGVALRDGQGGTVDHCTRTMALHGDFDAKLYADAPDPMAAALTALQFFGLASTAAVNTGGGFQGYWVLRAPVDLQDRSQRARVEALNRAIARAVCGPNRKPDAVHDVARILRLPGTINHKYNPPRQTRLLWCDPSRRYSLDDIEAYLTTHHRWAMDASRPTNLRPTSGHVGVGEGGRPGDDYNKRGDVRSILRRHGWVFLRERGGLDYWQRPHKHGMGTSATLNYADSGLFYVFTSDGAPFEPLGAYSAFAVYTLLEHDGDYAAAARTLGAQGYGDQTIDSGHDARMERVPTPRHAVSGGAAVPITPPELYEEALA